MNAMFRFGQCCSRRDMRRQSSGLRQRGFTLIELMIVITIIFILMAIAAPKYERAVLNSREAALRHDLQVMRQAIDEYTLDKQAAPQSLDDLVSGQFKYLREIPKDPITRQKDWRADFEPDIVLSPDQTTAGITDVHSSSDQVSPTTNSPYNQW